jgi:hypothetical protein
VVQVKDYELQQNRAEHHTEAKNIELSKGLRYVRYLSCSASLIISLGILDFRTCSQFRGTSSTFTEKLTELDMPKGFACTKKRKVNFLVTFS